MCRYTKEKLALRHGAVSRGIKHGHFRIHPAHGDRHDGHSGCVGGNHDIFLFTEEETYEIAKLRKTPCGDADPPSCNSRKLCTELYPNLYKDETAARLLDQIDYDFSEAEKNSRSLMQRFGALEVANAAG